MRHVLALLLVLVGLGGFFLGTSLRTASAQGPQATLIEIDGAIDPVSADFLSRGIDAAIEDGAPFVIVRLDTPGGMLSSTREMVEKIMASEVPVVVYVSPPGAQAASAGTFIAAAAHVAAMAPGTNIGAASPVGAAGEELPETLRSKATQDAAAFMRSIAEERDRNAEALEQTILSAKAYSASEALEQDIIDFIARDVDDLLAQLDGRAVALDSGQVVLETDGVTLRQVSRNPLERFLSFLADPNIAFLLLTIGGLGILVELLNPGTWVPGTVGVIALALAFVALGNLPVNWVGVALMALAMVFFFLELQAPGIGLFAVAGAVCFLLGAFLLFGGFSPPPIPRPSFRVSLWLIGAVSVLLFAFLAFLFRAVAQSRKAYVKTTETLVGRVGRVTSTLDPRGTVQVASELWSAVSDSGEVIEKGEEVIVSDVEGLTLKVFKASKAADKGVVL